MALSPLSPLSDLLNIKLKFLFQPHHALDFTVNILFSSYNFLGPFIFWLLNPRIRRRADLALYQMVSSTAQAGPLSLVQDCPGFALIGWIMMLLTPALLCNKELGFHARKESIIGRQQHIVKLWQDGSH